MNLIPKFLRRNKEAVTNTVEVLAEELTTNTALKNYSNDDIKEILTQAIKEYNHQKIIPLLIAEKEKTIKDKDVQIRNLQRQVENLYLDKTFIQSELQKAQVKSIEIEKKYVKPEVNKPLSDKQQKLYDVYINENPRTINEFLDCIQAAKIPNVNKTNLNVEISRMKREKGVIIKLQREPTL